jgi:hypothetical protein
MRDLIKPKQVTITDLDGEIHDFMIGRFPTIRGALLLKRLIPTGKDIFNGDDGNFLEHLKDVLYYASKINSDGDEIPLLTGAVIDNHVPDSETAIKLALLVLNHNTNFMSPENQLAIRNRIVQALGLSSTKISTVLADLLSQMAEQLTENSQPRSTRKTRSTSTKR